MKQFSNKQLLEIEHKGISTSVVEEQLQNFRNGFPFLSIKDAATFDNGGIKILSEVEQDKALDICNSFGGKVVKFVPASGAASRMFKDLFQALDDLKGGREVSSASARKFFDNLLKFPFMNSQEVLKMILYGNGLNYGATPKGLVMFHEYKHDNSIKVRTAFEEHLVEGARYAKANDGTVSIMFTVSPEHKEEFEALLNRVRDEYEKEYGCRYEISFTVQQPYTDIIAVDAQNRPFETSCGNLLFRPGGHGALLENLNEVNGDVIVIKNIDNVVREDLLPETVKWKQILIGRSIELAGKCHSFLKRMEVEDFATLKSDVLSFLKSEFSIDSSALNIPDTDLKEWAAGKLNRPIRVCGMVKNEGEPGGGPYLINEADGSTSLQILEAAQIDKNNAASIDKMKKSTHFNPVDLVCIVKDYKGNKFNLKQFTDPKTGFISEKSYEGKVLKAQELPGLWNGSMSRWNTQFVEVPLITFNPVKTVMDLLRPEHN